MKITGLQTTLFAVTLPRLLGDANLPQGSRRTTCLAVFLETDDPGLTGYALASPGARSMIVGLMPLVIGEDPRSVRGIWQRMVGHVFKGGLVGTAAGAISAIDIALWDLKAKVADEPLWRTLGARRDTTEVPAYASGLDLPLSSEDLRTYYRHMAGLGFRAGKLKVGLDPATDLERLAIVRDELGVDGTTPALMIDSNEYWAPKEAVRRIAEIETMFDLTWVEEPARRWDHRGLRSVSNMVKAAVATGENLHNVAQFTPLVANGAVDVVQVSAACAGVTGALQVAELADAFDLPVSFMANGGHVLAHVAAAIPNHCTSEVIHPQWPPAGARSTIDVRDGCFVLGDSPGNGLSFDPDELRDRTVEHPPIDSLDGGLVYRRGQGAATHGMGSRAR